jgi:hypothetical protein
MTDYTRSSAYGGGQESEHMRGTRNPAEIESDIRRTRDRMGEEIDAIVEKLSPGRIKQRAKEAVSRKTRETSRGLWRTARENPVPTAIVALGISMLMRARNKQRDRWNGSPADDWSDEGYGQGYGESRGEKVKERAQELVGQSKEKVEHVAERAAERARRTTNDLQSFFERNPVIAGAAVIVAGAAVGALLPETEKEKGWMGRARDELVDQVRDVAHQAKQTFEDKMPESGMSGQGGGNQRPGGSSPQSGQTSPGERGGSQR